MGPMLRAVNAVADAIAEEFPHVVVDTLACKRSFDSMRRYQQRDNTTTIVLADEYTRTPPLLTKPRPNVVIRYCVEPGQCDLRGTVSEFSANEERWQTNKPRPPSKYNGTAASDLRRWATITNRIYVWDYSTNFNNVRPTTSVKY